MQTRCVGSINLSAPRVSTPLYPPLLSGPNGYDAFAGDCRAPRLIRMRFTHMRSLRVMHSSQPRARDNVRPTPIYVNASGRSCVHRRPKQKGLDAVSAQADAIGALRASATTTGEYLS